MVKIKHHSRREIILAITYRPPKSCAKKCVDYLLETFNNIPRVDRSEVVIIGDLNINYGDLSNTNRNLLKHLTYFEAFTGMKQLINHPIRFGQIASTIDLILTNSDTIATSGVIPINLSDHEVVFVTSKKYKTQNTKKGSPW